MALTLQTTERKTCRVSGEKLIPLFSMGELHMSDFIPRDQDARLPKVEMKLCLAPKSGLVQLAHTAPFDDMYRTYWYRSGTNETMTNELRDIAESTQRLMRTVDGDVWVDIGCNDGTLLRFLNPKLTRIGFDPAKNGYSDRARKHANVIVEDYFNKKNYQKTKFNKKKAKVVTSIAMFYDLENPDSFVQDVYDILDRDGLWILQMSYTPLMLKQLAFDNICHEHLEYYTLHSLSYLLNRHNFQVVDCHLNDVNGGSFRIYVRKKNADPRVFASAPYRDVASHRVSSILAHEKTENLADPKTYIKFYRKVKALRDETLGFIQKERARGKKIWGYGASTKGNTLLQWFGLDDTLIDGIAERSPAKYGLKTAGSNIPIYSEDEMRYARPDYLLVLPWHFIDEFVRREQKFLQRGGKFIVPCPKFEVIGR
ncbi:class I SAM-dependent methyltransferase [bacterium]|nr:class I SAM-dependent methyltransferase [bacterium]